MLIEALAVTERDDDGVFGLAEGNEDRDFQRLAIDLQLDHRRGAVLALIIHRARGKRGF